MKGFLIKSDEHRLAFNEKFGKELITKKSAREVCRRFSRSLNEDSGPESQDEMVACVSCFK